MTQPEVARCSICGAVAVGYVAVEGDASRFHKDACEAHMAQIKDEGTLFALEQKQPPQHGPAVDPSMFKPF
jgi:hypothetical protein